VTTNAASRRPRTKIDVPKLFPDGVGVGFTGSGATVSITEGSIKLNVNLPINGTSFSARSE
jgi:hypothetical protein